MVFFDTEDMGFRMDGTNTSEWGNGQALYLMIAVKDTGIGISSDNQKKLFQRFRQATPKTEESYGGSGLGLMIARKLCQLHGGEIGVSSIEGEGSTFGFFFRVRRVQGDAKQAEEKDRMGSNDLMTHLHVLQSNISVLANTDLDPGIKLQRERLQFNEWIVKTRQKVSSIQRLSRQIQQAPKPVEIKDSKTLPKLRRKSWKNKAMNTARNPDLRPALSTPPHQVLKHVLPHSSVCRQEQILR